MKRVVIIGGAGRMGKAIVRCLQEKGVEGLELAGAVDLWDAPGLGEDIGRLSNTGETGITLSSDLSALASVADVFIDFSFHTGTAGNAERIAEWGIPWVIGTTGLTQEETETIKEASSKIPVLIAPNMSLGINLLFSLAEKAAEVLNEKEYDIEIIERHHRLKRDAPSGTALGLGDAVAKGRKWNLEEVATHGRERVAEHERSDQEIGFHAVRGGDFVGDHTVLFAATGESVELSHRATNRDTFAVGALKAGGWIVHQTPGLYSMKDVLGL